MDVGDHAARCPSCSTPLAEPPPSTCPRCRLPFGHARQRHLAQLDERIAELAARRRVLLALPDLPSAPTAAVVGSRDGRPPVDTEPAPVGALRGWLATAGPQTLLAAGGVLLLVIAAVVFTAVAWEQLPLLLRGGIVAAASAGCAALTRALVRRGLTRTAEATAVLSVALLGVLVNGLWRAGVLDGLGDGVAVFATAAAALAGTSHLLGEGTRTRAPFVLAAWLAPAAVVAAGAWLTDAPAVARDPAIAALLVSAGLLGGAIVACVYAEHRLGPLPRLRWASQLAGAVLWLLSVAGLVLTLASLAPSAAAERATFAAAGGLVASTALTAAYARRLGARDALWNAAGTAGMVFASTAGASGALFGRSAAWHELHLVVPLALGVAMVSTTRRSRRGAAIGMLPITIVSLAPVADTITELLELSAWRAALPWTTDARAAVLDAAPSALASALAIVALLGVVGRHVDRRAAIAIAPAGALLVIAAGVAAWTVAGGALVALVVVAGAAAVVRHAPSATVPLLATAGGTVLAAALALTTPTVTIVTLAVAAGATAVAVGARDRRASAYVAALVAADVIGLVAACAAATTDGPGPAGVAVAVAAAAGWAVAFVTRERPAVSAAIEGTAAVAFGVALGLAATDDAPWLAVAFALLAVAAASVAALRPDRRWMRWVATAAASGSSWTVLSDLDVGLVEAYTVPPAVVISALGAVTLRARPSASSWPALGTGLSLLVVPTVAQVVADPGDLPRLAAAVAVGVTLAVGGRALALQSPLVIGVGALTVAALTQHAVLTELLPRWALLAAAGALLLWLSISYEAQRLRLAVARRRLVAMR